jgi:hypothetical protein
LFWLTNPSSEILANPSSEILANPSSEISTQILKTKWRSGLQMEIAATLIKKRSQKC